MKKLTAVNWIKNKIEQYGDPENLIISWKDFDDLINQAREMEKEQITNAYVHGQNNGYMYRDGESDIIREEQYYNETFGKV